LGETGGVMSDEVFRFQIDGKVIEFPIEKSSYEFEEYEYVLEGTDFKVRSILTNSPEEAAKKALAVLETFYDTKGRYFENENGTFVVEIYYKGTIEHWLPEVK
jgi:hypothetical protein